MLAVIDTVAADLGNTRAVCRSSYIHPWFLNAWSEKRLLKTWEEFASMRRISGLSAGESTTLRVLKHLRKESR
jgi:DNA topoisomerase-1